MRNRPYPHRSQSLSLGPDSRGSSPPPDVASEGIDHDRAAARTSTSAHLVRGSLSAAVLVGLALLRTRPPADTVAPFGPFLAALIVLAVTEGKAGVIGLFRRMGRWRVNVIWYLIALATPVVLSAVAVPVNIALGADVQLSTANIDGLDVLTTFAMVLLIPGFGGAWEEPGWRGYAVPRLQSERSAVHAAFILGLLIAGWHLPLIVVGQVSWTDMIQIMGAVIIFNWLFNNARGSVLIIMLAHAVNNTVWSTLTSKVVAEPDFSRQAALQAVVWCVTAVIVVLVAGPANLSRRHVKQEEPPTLPQQSEHQIPAGTSRA